MKRIILLMALALFLTSSANVYAKTTDYGPHVAREDSKNEERGILPALVRWLERSHNADTRRSTTEDEAATTSTAETPVPDTTSSSTDENSTDTVTTPEPEPMPATPTVVTPSSSSSTAPAWGATTTPILNTHNGGDSEIYANEWPLNRAQSGLLFVFSMGLALSGLMLAERDSLRRLFPSGTIHTPSSPLSEKRTALS